MELQTELQTCATETIIEIISYLPSIRDRRALLQVSKRFYHITIPQIYSSWSYFGQNHQHSFKSLHCFLRTILQDQSLASQVQTLDIRDWKVDDPWGLPSPPTPRDTVNEIYDQDIELFCGAVRSLGLEHDLQYFKRYLRRRDEDILLAILIAKLPNLKTLYMTMPARALAIQSIVRGLSERSTPGVLENLERMCVCSGPNTGAKAYGDKYFDLEYIAPFFQIKSLRSLDTLGAFNYSRVGIETMVNRLLRASAVSELAFDESDAKPSHIFATLKIPKALKSLRWTRKNVYLGGSWYGPVYQQLGESLKAHEKTLEHLEIDLRLGWSHGEGLDRRDEDQRSDTYLIGWMRHLVALKTLVIEPLALCGERQWGVAPHRLVRILPPNLEALTLLLLFSPPGPYRERQLQSQIWIEQVAHLAETAESNLPKLRKIEIVMVDEGEHGGFFPQIELTCARAGISFVLSEKKPHSDLTAVPYFLEVLESRRSSRDR